MTNDRQIEDDEDEFDVVLHILQHQVADLRHARSYLEAEGGRTKALLFLRQVMQFARTLMGDAAYEMAMGRSNSAGGNDLLLLANRLQAISPFMQGDWSEELSYDAFVEEIYAIAGGDAPFLLAQTEKKRGKQGNSFRLAVHKLNALMWAQVLQRRGVTPSKRQSIISSSFGSTWESIRKWKTECIEKLGQDEYDRVMEFSAFADLKLFDGLMSDEEVKTAVYQAGQKFHAERLR